MEKQHLPPDKADQTEQEKKKTGSSPHKGYVNGGKQPATRPEQGPHVPPQQQTEGIP
ncbi:hypothetical protein [Pontibacter liquoris]|uniref:hypothetical protein n=1 Tax=Pontibacter liquoris TaxID=2905677 RepID=UPI001FA7942D|nr:hypothetical protein [Pontibacter liquoris]